MPSSDRQVRLLEAEDGRFFAIDKFGTGLATIATEERISRINVGFGLPSAPALFLNLAHKAFTSYLVGLSVAAFVPDKDPDGGYARRLVDLVAGLFMPPPARI